MRKEEQKKLLSMIPEDRKGKVKDFSEMKSFLPNSLREGELNFIKSYFRVQLRVSEGRRKKATEMYRGLEKKTGWEDFAKDRVDLLVLVDLAARGETKEFYEPVFYSVDISGN